MFVITLDRPSTSVVTMNYATQNGSASAGSDYVAASGSLVFAPGETAKTVKVTLINDTAAESSEAFNLVLSSLSNATTLDGTGTAIIFENDAAAVTNSNIYVDDLVVDESQAYADFIVRLDKPNTGTVKVNYTTVGGTAGSGSDFDSQSGFLTFAAGETEKTVRVKLTNDVSPESLQNFFQDLYSPSANATIADERAIADIIDNDAASGTPIARITDAVVDESAQTVSVTVILDKPSTGNVTLNVGSQNVIATDGGDFRSFPFGKVAFLPGEVAKTVVFGILNDTAAEGFESFDVVLSSPIGATIGDAISHVVIANSDAAPAALPSITIAEAVALETKGTVDFLVSLSAPSASQVKVNYSTASSTATSGGDFSNASGTLVFAPGEITKSVRITLADDIVAETTLENFTLTLNGAVNATIATPLATATIKPRAGRASCNQRYQRA
ncbi:Calx-beta domain-containing protein [Methylomonas sp. MED-D]|uniref:Calx-beta domain-containing protein n=1 Tax=Methylomonas sp. MED-D TaxID=3418768 RepID=UPI003D066EEF